MTRKYFSGVLVLALCPVLCIPEQAQAPDIFPPGGPLVSVGVPLPHGLEEVAAASLGEYGPRGITLKWTSSSKGSQGFQISRFANRTARGAILIFNPDRGILVIEAAEGDRASCLQPIFVKSYQSV